VKKELALHFLSAIILFVLIFLFRNYLAGAAGQTLSTIWPFWVGGIIGTILPDIDHLIYVYYLRPYEVTSQRVAYMAQKGQLLQSWHLLASTRSERTNLILHTVIFQILFLILGFLVVTSSGSLLGRGLVIAFLLHLFVDQIIDLRQTGNLSNWFRQIPIVLDRIQINIYLGLNFVSILIFSFLL